MPIKEEDLLEWQTLDEEASELTRKAKTLRDRQSQLEEKFAVELKKSGKASMKRLGFLLAWMPGRATVQWAAEYLKECGAEKANQLKQAAADAAAKGEKKLSITPPKPTE
ncbi:hypothetical protein SH501x_001403 [Pirellulaceae bacterium SH501]